MSRRRRVREDQTSGSKEPLVLWWMPVVALAAPLLYAGWRFASAANAAEAALEALLWPGLALYAAGLALLWGGWKIDLE
jgi:hypothetical protein